MTGKGQSTMHLSLGPFQGITDVYFRKLFQQHFGGVDKYYTPFFTGVYKSNNRSIRSSEISPEWNEVNLLTPQILSRDASEIIIFGKACKDLGYSEINLNMGCPYPRVAKKKRGSGLLPHPQIVEKLLDEVKSSLDVKLSIKCRLGYENPHEIDALLPLFNKYGLSELIVHARIGRQLYKGGVDTQRFRDLIGQLETTLVYNGDVFSVESHKAFQEEFAGINHWMLGRGLLADPFLALDLKGDCNPGTDGRKEKVFRFVTDLYLQRRKVSCDRPTALGRMKELWSYLVWSFGEPLAAWRLIRRSTDFDQYETAIAQVFQQQSWKGQGYANRLKEQSQASQLL